MKATAIDDLFLWSRYQPDRHIDFNGFLWRRPAGALLVDPLPMTDHESEFARARGPVRWILLTNADHWRGVDEARSTFGAIVLAPEPDRERFGTRAVDAWFGSTSDLPAEIAHDVAVHWVAGGKSRAEAVLELRPAGALLFGDVVRSRASGELTTLPADKIADARAMWRDLSALAALRLDTILLGDGDCLFRGACGAFDALLARAEPRGARVER